MAKERGVRRTQHSPPPSDHPFLPPQFATRCARDQADRSEVREKSERGVSIAEVSNAFDNFSIFVPSPSIVKRSRGRIFPLLPLSLFLFFTSHSNNFARNSVETTLQPLRKARHFEWYASLPLPLSLPLCLPTPS